MSNGLKRFLFVVGMIVLSLGLVAVISHPIKFIGMVIAGVAALIIGVPIAWFLFKGEAKKIVREIVEEASRPAGPPKVDIGKLLNKLVEITVEVRTGEQVDRDIIALVDGIVDELGAVVPQMVERYPFETITFELNRVCEAHLLKLLEEYLDLSVEVRASHKKEMLTSLNGILKVAQDARRIVERNETGEFAVMARFLQEKFSSM